MSGKRSHFRFGDVIRINDAYAKKNPGAYVGTMNMVINDGWGVIVQYDPRDHRKSRGLGYLCPLPQDRQLVEFNDER